RLDAADAPAPRRRRRSRLAIGRGWQAAGLRPPDEVVRDRPAVAACGWQPVTRDGRSLVRRAAAGPLNRAWRGGPGPPVTASVYSRVPWPSSPVHGACRAAV